MLKTRDEIDENYIIVHTSGDSKKSDELKIEKRAPSQKKAKTTKPKSPILTRQDTPTSSCSAHISKNTLLDFRSR